MRPLLQTLCTVGLLLSGMVRALAQGSQDALPVISLEVGQAEFTEQVTGAQDAAWFVVKRSGFSAGTLPVYLRYTGTATPEVDYGPAPATVTFEPGQSEVRVLLYGKADALAEGDETIVAQVIDAPGDPATGLSFAYLVDTEHATAKFTLHDRPTSLPPLVLVEATDAFVQESGKTADGTPATAKFRISRSGSTERELLVFLQAGGHATAGVDYQKLPDSVRIPAGERSMTLAVVPIDDALSEGTEEVLLQIVQPPTAGAAVSYVTDYASDHADAYILDDEPYIVIERPEDHWWFERGASVPIQVLTISSNGFVAHVDFFADDTKIGESTLNFFANPAPGTPIRHEFTWTNPPAGRHRLTASTPRADGVTIAAMRPVTVFTGELGGLNVLTLELTDGHATEPADGAVTDDPIVVTVHRRGDVSQPLNASLDFAGTARQGADFSADPADGEFHFNAGESATKVTLHAKADGVSEGPETVEISLVTTDCENAGAPCYLVGTHEPLVATIDDPVSSKPSLTITSPKDGETVRAGETNKVVAVGIGRVGGITDVELLLDGQKVAESHLTFFRPPGADEPVTHEFAIVIPTGEHQLVARDLSDPALSSPTVKITAQGGTAVVTITTARSPAYELDRPVDRIGSFTMTRSGGDLSLPLTVFYTLNGTATPGVDYQVLDANTGGPSQPNDTNQTSVLRSLQFPAGLAATDLTFAAIPDKLVEGTETVVATLVQSPLAGPLPSYEIGEPHEARAEIRDSANPLRLVVLNAPTNGAVFTSPATIHVEATAEITGVGIAGLLFTANGIEIGHALYCCETCFCAEPTPGQPFSGGIEWKDVKPGTYTLVAKALTFLDSIPESDPVTITVLGPPPTPQLTITQPTNGASLRADESTKVVAVGIGRVGGITDVELLLDGKKVAESHLSFIRPPGADEPVTHEFNVRLPAGDHELVARDLSDAHIVSPAVHVHVTDPNPLATLTWVKPEDGAKFPPGTPIDLEVAAFDPKALIFHADFFADGRRIGGADYSCPLCKPAPGATLSIPFQWTGAPIGKHLLSAVATNSAGLAVGTPRITIEVTAPPGPRIAATRKLPAAFQPGVKFTVSITVQPGDGVQDYVVEDHPPFLFGGGAVPPPDQPLWDVTAISDGGVFDFSTGAVKFGPFFDHQARTLTYEITPNTAAIGVAEFTGIAVADGTEVQIGGDRQLLGNSRHPADRDPADDRLSATELTAYGAAWKAGLAWPLGPNPIPMDYVTRAGALWRGGESYRFDPTAGPAPLCWVSNPILPPATSTNTGATSSAGLAKPAFHGIALRRVDGQAGKTLSVTVRVLPAPGVNAFAVEEQVAGAPGAISEGGTFVAATKTVHWGPFLDGQPHTVTYQLEGAAARRPEHGAASFDGASVAVLPAGPPGSTGPRLISVGATDDGAMQIVVDDDTMTADTAYELEVSTDLQHWSQAGPFVNGGTAAFARDEVPAATGPRFYRAVRSQ